MRRKAGIIRWARQLALVLAVVAALGVTAYAEDAALVETGSGVTVNYAVNGEALAWKYDSDKTSAHGATVYIAGNSGSTEAGVSNLGLTVTQTGTLTFSYLVKSPENNRGTLSNSQKYYGLFYQVNTALSAENYTGAANWDDDWVDNYGFTSTDWCEVSVPINAEDLVDGSATLYIAYVRTHSNSVTDNYVAISNVSFTSNQKTLAVNADAQYGAVSANVGVTATESGYTCSVESGTVMTLTASTKEDGQFYGWVEDGKLLSTDETYTTTLTADRTIQAVFAAEGTYTARRNGVFYTGDNGLTNALKAAVSDDTVVMLKSQTLNESVTVPYNVFLLLPCMDDDPGYVSRYSPDGTEAYPETGYSHCSLYGTLTIPSNVTLTVKGKVLVNAEVGRPQAGWFDQDVNGGYAQIDLEGNIVVEKYGYLENYGYIKGSGQVTAKDKSTLVDLYVVRHWRGGSQADKMYDENIYPMNEIDCHNIQTTIRIEYGASYQGAVKMYASYSFHNTRFPQVDTKNSIIQLKEGAYLIKTYDPDYTVTDSNGVAHKEGRSYISIYGGATFASSTLYIVTASVSTKSFLFPLDGDLSLKLYDGNYSVVNDFKLMPGCTVDLMSGATLTIGSEDTSNNNLDGIATVVLYNEFNDLPNTGYTQYPSYRPAATLTLHNGATLNVTETGALAGHVAVDSDATAQKPAVINLDSASILAVTTKEARGYFGTYDTNAVTLNFTAALLSADGTSSLTPAAGTTYYGTKADGWSTTKPIALPGDLNDNKIVNIDDLNMLLDNFGKSGTGLVGDINNNGIVNIDDLNMLLDYFGKNNLN